MQIPTSFSAPTPPVSRPEAVTRRDTAENNQRREAAERSSEAANLRNQDTQRADAERAERVESRDRSERTTAEPQSGQADAARSEADRTASAGTNARAELAERADAEPVSENPRVASYQSIAREQSNEQNSDATLFRVDVYV